MPVSAPPTVAPEPEAPRSATPEPARAAHRVVYLDLETQRSAAEVGGWHNAHLMRVAVAVTFDTATDSFETFREADVSKLVERLDRADLVVGFNISRFDYQVLRGYTDRDLNELPIRFNVSSCSGGSFCPGSARPRICQTRCREKIGSCAR